MIDFIAKLISGNGVNTIVLIAVAYIALLWFLFSFWVYVDAKKRYKRSGLAIMYFLVVFIFNFPALIFYLITRPEDEGEFVLLPADNLSNKGVNIPIVNFIGKDGKVNLSFELKINNQEISLNNSDMSIDVNWKSDNQDFKKVEEPIQVKVEETDKKTEVAKINVASKFKNQATNSFKNVKTKVNSFKPKFNLPKKDNKKANS